MMQYYAETPQGYGLPDNTGMQQTQYRYSQNQLHEIPAEQNTGYRLQGIPPMNHAQKEEFYPQTDAFHQRSTENEQTKHLHSNHSAEFHTNLHYHSKDEAYNSGLQRPNYSENRGLCDVQERNHQQPLEQVQQRFSQVQMHDDYQFNNVRKYPSGFRNELSNDMQESWQNDRDPSIYRSHGDEYNRNVNNNRQDPRRTTQQKTYGEPIRLHEIGKPQVLAKTSGDGDAVAVFGVVAQVEKSPTSQVPSTTNQFSTNHQQKSVSAQPSSYESTNRAHLAPIMEQPSPPSVSTQNYRESNIVYVNQQQNFSRESSDKRKFVHHQKSDSNEFNQRNRFSGDHERHREIYRDEYTDSGYGSTLTERSYEGPMKNQARFGPDNREHRVPEQRAKEEWQKPSYNQPNPTSSYNGPASNQYDGHQQRSQNPQWASDIRQEDGNYAPHNRQYQQISDIDASQTRRVSSMKKMFDKPGSIPLPPVSTSYGASQYSTDNLRQISPGTRIPSNEDRYQNEQRTSEPNYHPNSPPYHSYENVSQQVPQKYSSGPTVRSYEQQSQLQQPSTQSFPPHQQYSEPRSPPGQPSHPYAEKPPLPHFEPPPQHSQSMNALDDLQPQETRASQQPRSRGSYTNKQDNDMVVGVRFEKRSTVRNREEQHRSISLSPSSYGPNHQPDNKLESDKDRTRFSEPSEPSVRQTSPDRSQQIHQQHYRQENFNREQRTNVYSQPSTNFRSEDNHFQSRPTYRPPEMDHDHSQSTYAAEQFRPHESQPTFQTPMENKPLVSHSHVRKDPPESRPLIQPKPSYVSEERRPPPSQPRDTYAPEGNISQPLHSGFNDRLNENQQSSQFRSRNHYQSEEGRFQTHSHSRNSYPSEEGRPPSPHSQPRDHYPSTEARPLPSHSYPRDQYSSDEVKPPPSHSQPRDRFSPQEVRPPPHSHPRDRYPSDEGRPPPSHSQPRDHYPSEEVRHPPYSNLTDQYPSGEVRPPPSHSQPSDRFPPDEGRPPPSHLQTREQYSSGESRSPPSQFRNQYPSEETRPLKSHFQPRSNDARQFSKFDADGVDPRNNNRNHPSSRSQSRDEYVSAERRPPADFFPNDTRSKTRNEFAHEERKAPLSTSASHDDKRLPPNHSTSRGSYAHEESRSPPVFQSKPSYAPEVHRPLPSKSYHRSDLSPERTQPLPRELENPTRGQTKSSSPEFPLQPPQRMKPEREKFPSQSKHYDRSRDGLDRIRETEQNQDSEHENYVPDVVRKSYGLFSESENRKVPPQASEDWPEPPNIEESSLYQIPDDRQTRVTSRTEPPQQAQSYSTQSQPNRYESKQSSGGNDNKTFRQIPRHPFDPDDDSSEEVDVDAPTPPPSNKRKQYLYSRELPREQNTTQFLYRQRAPPNGERHQTNSRQPEDTSNEDRSSSSQLSQPQTSNATRPIAPKKPSRSSLKQKDNIVPQNELPNVLFEDSSPPLSHKHSKDRARLVQAGKVAKKPPNRSQSSTVLTQGAGENDDFEITVTSNDLVRTHASQEIIVHRRGSECHLTEKKAQKTGQSQQTLNEGTQTELPTKSQETGKVSEPPKKMKLIFKPAPANALKQEVRLPDVKEPMNGDRKLPPTYTDLLGQFKSHRVNALRNAVEKHDRALKTAQAAMRDPKSSKRDENQNIYNQSKPKPYKENSADKDRSRSSGHKPRSPERHDRHHKSPEHRSRDLDRDHRSRKSERERSSHRIVSPHRGGKDEDPYRHRRDEPPSRSRNHGKEPDWVEQVRRRQAQNEDHARRRDHPDDRRSKQKKEFDFDQYQRDVKQATSFNNDFDQPPVRKQMFPTKLMAKGNSKPGQRPPQGNADWMKNLKDQNRKANRNR